MTADPIRLPVRKGLTLEQLQADRETCSRDGEKAAKGKSPAGAEYYQARSKAFSLCLSRKGYVETPLLPWEHRTYVSLKTPLERQAFVIDFNRKVEAGARMPPRLLAPPPMPSGIILNPEWVRRPTGDDLARYYPAAAQALGIQGRAEIQCGVNANGTLADCAIVSEDPPEMGFGDTALALAPLFQMRSTTPDGRPVAGGTVMIPFRFTLG